MCIVELGARLLYDGGTETGRMPSLHQSNSSPSLLASPASQSPPIPSLLDHVKQHLLNQLNVWDVDFKDDITPWSAHTDKNQTVVEFFIGDEVTEGDIDSSMMLKTHYEQSAPHLQLDGHFGSYSLGQRSCSMMELNSNISMRDTDVVSCT